VFRWLIIEMKCFIFKFWYCSLAPRSSTNPIERQVWVRYCLCWLLVLWLEYFSRVEISIQNIDYVSNWHWSLLQIKLYIRDVRTSVIESLNVAKHNEVYFFIYNRISQSMATISQCQAQVEHGIQTSHGRFIGKWCAFFKVAVLLYCISEISGIRLCGRELAATVNFICVECPQQSYASGKLYFLRFSVVVSGESRIVFLPERSSIYQHRPEISAIIVKK